MGIALITVVALMSLTGLTLGKAREYKMYSWNYGGSAEKTLLFTNSHWWESLDHQMTTTITLLALSQNTSSIAVIPTLAAAGEHGRTNASLLGDYFDIGGVRKVQNVITFLEFLQSEEYQALREDAQETTSTVRFPKESQEEYERSFGIYGQLTMGRVKLDMPNVDPENTNQPCNWFGGTMHMSRDGTIRYVFLERVHFLHFCTEKYMSWWYDVRYHIQPRKEYMQVVQSFMKNIKSPLTVVHVNDVMEKQKTRDDVEIERYARQIVDALRVNDAMSSSLYVIYSQSGRNVGRVVGLLQQEMDRVHKCEDMFDCLQSVRQEVMAEPSGDGTELLFQRLFRGEHSVRMTEWALAAEADVFVGNIHSPYSRNIALFRKTHGRPYSAVRGFAELRKVWSWNL